MLDHRLLSAAVEAGLARRIQTGDDAATHELVRHNLRLARFIAERFAERHPNLDRDDLCSEAVLALYQAARKFDPHRGRFAHYAGFYVREALRSAMNLARYGQRRPPPGEDRNAAADASWRWLEQTGRDASIDDLVTMLGWKRARLLRALAGTRTVSLDAPSTTAGHTLGDVIADASIPRADVHAARNDTCRAVRSAIAQLDPRARTVIEHRFGLMEDGSAHVPHRRAKLKINPLPKNPHALRAVGTVVGLTGERVRQIERAALLTLRRLLADDDAGTGRRDEETRALEARLLGRFTGQRIVVVDSFSESGLWFAAHRLTQRGILRPGPCANTWLIARAKEKSETRFSA